MGISNFQSGVPFTRFSQVSSSPCGGESGCGPCSDFSIGRDDTLPSLRLRLNTCDGTAPVPAEGLAAAEASMWFDAKISVAVDDAATDLVIADGIGIERTVVGMRGVMRKGPVEEVVAVTAVDRDAKTITVTRGDEPADWAKGQTLRLYVFFEQPVDVEYVYRDEQQEDGTILEGILHQVFLLKRWATPETAVSGCYKIQFRVFEQDDQGADTGRVQTFPRGSPLTVEVV